MRIRVAMIGVVVAVAAIGTAAAVGAAQAVDPVVAGDRAVDPVVAGDRAVDPEAADGVVAQVVSMPLAATPICPGARWPKEARAGC
jgi:hypothetical protein